MTGPYPPPTQDPVRRNYQPAPAGVWLCERRHANSTAGATGSDPAPVPRDPVGILIMDWDDTWEALDPTAPADAPRRQGRPPRDPARAQAPAAAPALAAPPPAPASPRTRTHPVPPPGALPPRRPGEGVAPVDPEAARRARARSSARGAATKRLQRIIQESR